MTPLMQADEIAHAFNGSAERQYWRAVIGGPRTDPHVSFNSRASMVTVAYYPSSGQYGVSYSKTQCSFGDFLASAHRSLVQVQLALKSIGLNVTAPLDNKSIMRLEYDPATKLAAVALAQTGDDWVEAQPASFKVLATNLPEL